MPLLLLLLDRTHLSMRIHFPMREDNRSVDMSLHRKEQTGRQVEAFLKWWIEGERSEKVANISEKTGTIRGTLSPWEANYFYRCSYSFELLCSLYSPFEVHSPMSLIIPQYFHLLSASPLVHSLLRQACWTELIMRKEVRWVARNKLFTWKWKEVRCAQKIIEIEESREQNRSRIVIAIEICVWTREDRPVRCFEVAYSWVTSFDQGKLWKWWTYHRYTSILDSTSH